ncbi:MAG: replicative DNA helicase [bacterium]|nr:replicative DNA helicase [bacterium]
MNREIPHNIDAEQSVLGSMFLTKKALQKSLELLDGSEFYLDNHAKIFECIKSLDEKGSVVDLTTVADELNNRNWLKNIGDIDYLTEIIESVPSSANIDEYIKIVEDKAILRRLIDEATSIITDSYNTSNNIGEVIEQAEKKIFDVSKSLRSTEFKSIQDVLYKAQSDLEKLAQNKGDITGIPTGFYELDKITSGFHPHELIIIAARPGMGKTAIALNMVTNIAINSKKTVALFNMEMGAEQLAMRMLSNVGRIEGSKLKTGNLEHSDWKRVNEAISRLSGTKIYIDDTAGNTVGEIRSKCRKLATSPSGLDIVVIDYLTLIQGSSKNGSNRQQEVADISRALKTMAMELNVPVIALSQLSRGIEKRDDKKPMLSDLRESGAIEQDADIVAFLHCSDEEREKENSLMEFVIRKHRNGPLKDIPLLFQRGTSTFENVANVPEEG